jgi:hypothetical protein
LATDGAVNTGGGAGGQGWAKTGFTRYGKTGGSGIVIVRYTGTAIKATGGSISTVTIGGQAYVVHEFTSTGTFALV